MSILIHIYLFVIRMLARFEIFYNMYVSKYLNMNFNSNPPSVYIYVNDGIEVFTCESKEEYSGKYELVIKKSYSSDNNCYYGRVSHNTEIFNKTMYITDDETFMGIVLKDLETEKDYDIDLKKPINFYIMDNILLDNGFIKWYMNSVYGVVINDYKIDLIDSEMNEHTLNKESFIELSKNNYCLSNVIDESWSEVSGDGYSSDEESGSLYEETGSGEQEEEEEFEPSLL